MKCSDFSFQVHRISPAIACSVELPNYFSTCARSNYNNAVMSASEKSRGTESPLKSSIRTQHGGIDNKQLPNGEEPADDGGLHSIKAGE